MGPYSPQDGPLLEGRAGAEQCMVSRGRADSTAHSLELLMVCVWALLPEMGSGPRCCVCLVVGLSTALPHAQKEPLLG